MILCENHIIRKHVFGFVRPGKTKFLCIQVFSRHVAYDTSVACVLLLHRSSSLMYCLIIKGLSTLIFGQTFDLLYLSSSKAVLLLWIIYVFVMPCTRLFICALWSPAGKELTSWLSFVVSNCEFVTFPLVSWVRCGT